MENVEAAPELINVLDPETQEVGSIAKGQLPDAISQGYQPASNEQVEKFLNQQKYGTPGQQLLTGLEGATSAASLGLIPGFGKKGESLLRREENPIARMAGEAAGLVGSSLLVPGEGAAGLMTKAGKGAADLLGVEGTGLAARAARGAAQSAAETAIFQGGDEVSKLIAGDPNQSLDTAAANIGLAALIGAPFGAGTGAISPLWDAKLGGKVGEFIEDFKGRINHHINNPDPVAALTDELTAHHQNITSMADEVYGPKGLKAQEIEKLMPETITDKIVTQAEGLGQKTQALIDTMEKKPNVYPERLVEKLKSDLETFQAQLASPKSAAEVFNATQDLKQTVQGYSKFDKFVKPVDEAYDFVRSMKELGHDLRNSLEDSSVWGKAAERQKAVNAGFRDYLPKLQDFEKRFTTLKSDGERIVDPGKINTFVNQLGKPNAELKQQMLADFLEASEKYRGVIDKTHANLGLESPFTPSALQAAKQSLQEITPGQKAADIVMKNGLTRLSGQGLGALVGGAAGHTVGAGGFGALLGEHALGPFFSSILPSLIKPIMENPASAKGLKSAVDYALSVFKGETLLNKAVKNTLKAGQFVIAQNQLPTEKDRAKLEKVLKAYQENPNKMFEVGGDTGHYLPNHAQALGEKAMTAVQYLNSLKPSTAKNAPLDGEVKVSKVAEGAYQNALNIAEQPLVVLEHISKGTLTPEDLIHLNNLYPGLHQSLIQKVTAEIAEVTDKGDLIPYKVRLGLSMLMGQPLDSTMTPQAIQATQPQAQQPPNEPQQIAKHSMSALNKMASLDMTPQQSREVARMKS